MPSWQPSIDTVLMPLAWMSPIHASRRSAECVSNAWISNPGRKKS